MSEPMRPRLDATTRAARVGNALIFASHALLFASWTPHIPAVKDRIGLHEGTLGLALLGAPVGAIVAVVLVGPALARWGSRRVVRVTLTGYAATGPLLGVVDSFAGLFAVLAVWGAFQGSLDVAMNSQAVTIERRYGRPIMSSFHAIWAIGAATGAGLGSLAVLVGVGLAAQLTVLAVVVVAAMLVLTRRFLGSDHAAELEPDDGPRRRFDWFGPRMAVIAAVMFAALLCEGAAADWAPLYLRDDTHADEAVAGLAYATFATAMFVARALGDRWVARFGGGRVVGVLALVGGAGLGIALVMGHPGAGLVGFAAYGLGIACIVPVCLSAAAAEAERSGAHAGPVLASADGTGRAGFLLGPALIGNLAHATSLPVALGVLPVCCVGIALASTVLGCAHAAAELSHDERDDTTLHDN